MLQLSQFTSEMICVFLCQHWAIRKNEKFTTELHSHVERIQRWQVLLLSSPHKIWQKDAASFCALQSLLKQGYFRGYDLSPLLKEIYNLSLHALIFSKRKTSFIDAFSGKLSFVVIIGFIAKQVLLMLKIGGYTSYLPHILSLCGIVAIYNLFVYILYRFSPQHWYWEEALSPRALAFIGARLRASYDPYFIPHEFSKDIKYTEGILYCPERNMQILSFWLAHEEVKITEAERNFTEWVPLVEWCAASIIIILWLSTSIFQYLSLLSTEA